MINLKKIIREDSILLHVAHCEKTELIKKMLDILTRTKRVKNSELALFDLLEREKKMSTGMEHGIAFPHAKTDAVDKLVSSVALVPDGVNFKALDGYPSYIFIMVLSPRNKTGPHIEFIASVASLLKTEQVRESLLHARTKKDVITTLTAAHGRK